MLILMEPESQLLWGLVALWRGFQADGVLPSEQNRGFVVLLSSLGNIKNK